MSEMAPEPTPVTRVARDLSAILDLYAQLPSQAVADSADHLMPGGHAMVALAPVANLEAWENLEQATERYAKTYVFVEVEDDENLWPATQLLAYWAERWRAIHGAEYGQRPTLPREANFIRYQLEWAWENEPGFEKFAKDVNSARIKLEDVLFAGSRVEKTRVECPDCQVRLIVLRGSEPEDDRWKCQGCKARYDQDDVRRAHAKMLRSEGAERWVHQRDAIDILKSLGRPERTVRDWLAQGEGEGYCDPVDHMVWCWWPSLWRKHLMTPTRQRGRAG